MIRFLAVFACVFALSSSVVAAPFWTTAYYGNWRQDRLPPEQIDFQAMTHIVHFSVLPKPDGTLDADNFKITPTSSQKLIELAHKQNVKVLLCVGGEHTAPAFRSAISPENRARFITNLVTFATTRGYDGIDIDFEPMKPTDAPHYIDFIRELHAQTSKRNPPLLLTCATSSEREEIFAQLQKEFDQINIMTYDMSGAWPGWQTWHNAPLRDSKLKIKNSNTPFPSIEAIITRWLKSGVQRSKLGIGAAFYAVAWPRVTGPHQPVEGLKSQQLYYSTVLSKYYKPERFRWDPDAGAAYLSVDEEGVENDMFISFEDERALRHKVLWARQQGLGGLIIWELANGYLTDAPEGRRDPLLQAVRAAREEKLPENTEPTK
jgi:chitinase